MKLFVIACLICVVSASYAPIHVAPVTKALASTGTSQSSRTQSSDGNYAFQYNEQHSTGGSSRQETGNGWAAQGSYTLNVGDGRSRIVRYIADGAGFRAAIATNEPGTAQLPAASTAISSPFAPPQPVEPLPVPVVAAPVAPVAVAAPAPEPIAQYALPLAPAPEPVAVAAPVIASVPSVSSYSSTIDHVVPAAAPVAVHAPAIPAIPALPAPILTKHVAAPVPIPSIPALPTLAVPALPLAPVAKVAAYQPAQVLTRGWA